MTAKEIIAALRSAPSRSKRELFDTAADMIEALLNDMKRCDVDQDTILKQCREVDEE